MRWWILIALAACQTGHEVKLLLGPDEDTISAGFLCTDDMNVELMRRASIGGNPPVFQFGVVVDIIGIGDRGLGCRGEELVTACADGACQLLERACRVVSVELGAPSQLLEDVQAQLAGLTVAKNAPDGQVIVRIVAYDLPSPMSPTATECPAFLLERATNLEPNAVGCAYSCPVELDNVDTVSVSLDTLSRQCEPLVKLCARFPF
jgi:hypothetical protein